MNIIYMKPYNIKGTARALYPVHVERAQYGQYYTCTDNIGHKAYQQRNLSFESLKAHEEASICFDTLQTHFQTERLSQINKLTN